MVIESVDTNGVLVDWVDGWNWRYCVKLGDGRHAHLFVKATEEELQELSYWTVPDRIGEERPEDIGRSEEFIHGS